MKLTSWIRGAGAAVVVLAAAGVASAQDAFTVSPQRGAIGQEITLTAAEDGAFGARRGKVLLALAAEKRRRPPTARIVSWSESQIVFSIHRATAGLQDVTVRPRGRRVTPLVVNGGLEVVGPQLTGRSADRFGKGDSIMLFGNNFGTVRGKVKLIRQTGKAGRGRRPRILSWSNDTVEVKLPTRGPNGLFDIELSNFAGVAQGMSPIELVPPLKPITGKDRVEGRGERPINAVAGNKGDQVSYGVAGTVITISATDTTGGSRSVTQSLTLTFDPGVGPGEINIPQTYSGTSITAMDYVYTEESRRGTESATYAYDGDGEITVTNVVGNRISGTFGAQLTRVSGDGPSRSRVVGTFVGTRSP